MRIKHLLFSVFSLACISEGFAASHHHRANCSYFKLEGGLSIASISSDQKKDHYHDDSFDNAGVFGVEAGYKFTDFFRTGVNFSHRSHKFEMVRRQLKRV